MSKETESFGARESGHISDAELRDGFEQAIKRQGGPPEAVGVAVATIDLTREFLKAFLEVTHQHGFYNADTEIMAMLVGVGLAVREISGNKAEFDERTKSALASPAMTEGVRGIVSLAANSQAGLVERIQAMALKDRLARRENGEGTRN